MKCLIIAAGYATRLYPLTENFPKPLLKVGDKPILDWLMEDLDQTGLINEYIVVTNHKFAPIFEEWAKQRTDVTVIDDGSRFIIDVGYDTALKIMLRNTMIDMMVRPAELARRLKVSNQRLNSILSFRKTTGLNALADCFNALGKPLSITP